MRLADYCACRHGTHRRPCLYGSQCVIMLFLSRNDIELQTGGSLWGPVGTELWAPSCFKDVNSLSLTPGFVLYLPGVFNF